MAEAQAQYLALVKPGNDYSDAHMRRTNAPDVTDFAGWRTVCTRMAENDFALMEGLAAGKWPAQAQGPVATFISRLADDRAGWQQCARATDLNGQDAGVGVANDAKSGAAAAVVRVSLGLPPNS